MGRSTPSLQFAHFALWHSQVWCSLPTTPVRKRTELSVICCQQAPRMKLLQPFLRRTSSLSSSLPGRPHQLRNASSLPRALLLAPGQQSLRNEYYALRHGWSKANEAGIIVSRIDSGARLEYGLHATGQEQARAAAERRPCAPARGTIRPPPAAFAGRRPAGKACRASLTALASSRRRRQGICGLSARVLVVEASLSLSLSLSLARSLARGDSCDHSSSFSFLWLVKPCEESSNP